MKRTISTHLPFLASSAILVVFMLLIAFRSYHYNDNHLIYTLDDPYIHMAMAKNLVQHNVLGVDRYGFSSSTSSPLWTVLIAVSYGLAGIREWIPGVWALLFAIASLYMTDLICRRFGLAPIFRFIVCILVLYFTPLIALISTGMEHTMHLFFVLLLFLYFVSLLESHIRRTLALVCLAALLATASRYETLFIVGPFTLILFCYRRFASGVLLLAAALVPVVLYGVFSFSNGGYFLPNSLMMKGVFYEITGLRSVIDSLLYAGFVKLTNVSYLFNVCILLLLSSIRCNYMGRHALFWVSLALPLTMLLHLQYALTGWFYRYEGYLIALGMVIVAVTFLADARLRGAESLGIRRAGQNLAIALLGLLLLWPLVWRGKYSYESIVPASRNIYEQQYQMARFLADEFDPGTRVAVNDLGAVTFYADIEVLDLVGIGSVEFAQATRAGQWGKDFISESLEAHETEFVIVYMNWFDDGRELPDHLIPVSRWTISNNVVCGGDAVTFFGTTVENAKRLHESLARFSKELPSTVRVENYAISGWTNSAD
jgi:hypothetical protein